MVPGNPGIGDAAGDYPRRPSKKLNPSPSAWPCQQLGAKGSGNGATGPVYGLVL